MITVLDVTICVVYYTNVHVLVLILIRSCYTNLLYIPKQEVFASPNHNTGSVPVPSSTQRRPLSTTISDDVFVLPPKPVLPTHSVEKQIGELKREGPSLTHVRT